MSWQIFRIIFSKEKVVNQVHGDVDQVNRSGARGPWLSLNGSRSCGDLRSRFNRRKGYAPSIRSYSSELPAHELRWADFDEG
jgi:hypothetical protein